MAFIDLANVEIVDEVSEDAKVLVEENGEIKRTGMPSGGIKIADFKYVMGSDGESIAATCNMEFEELYNLIIAGEFVVARIDISDFDVGKMLLINLSTGLSNGIRYISVYHMRTMNITSEMFHEDGAIYSGMNETATQIGTITWGVTM